MEEKSRIFKQKGITRGPYGPRKRYNKGTKIISHEIHVVEYDQVKYFELENGMLLPDT